MCDWQYNEYGYDSSEVNWNARNVFHIFTILDNNVFNTTQYRIKDENLLTQVEKDYIAGMGVPFDSVEVKYTFKPVDSSAGRNSVYSLVTTCNIVDVCIGQEFATRHLRGTSSMPQCTVMTFSICTGTWDRQSWKWW